MLRKLLKYEIPALGRKLAPLYLAWAAASVFLGLALRMVDSKSELFLVISVMLYTGIVTAVGVMTIILIIQRFNGSLLGEGGYFNLVLPVPVSAHIANKVVASLIWLMISMLAALGSVLIIVMLQEGAIRTLLAIEWKEILRHIHLYDFGHVLELLILAITSFAKSILGIYAAITIGHQARERVTLASIGSYIGVLTFEAFISWLQVKMDLPMMFADNAIADNATFHTFVICSVATSLILGALYFLICRFLMEKRLNLA